MHVVAHRVCQRCGHKAQAKVATLAQARKVDTCPACFKGYDTDPAFKRRKSRAKRT